MGNSSSSSYQPLPIDVENGNRTTQYPQRFPDYGNSSGLQPSAPPLDAFQDDAGVAYNAHKGPSIASHAGSPSYPPLKGSSVSSQPAQAFLPYAPTDMGPAAAQSCQHTYGQYSQAPDFPVLHPFPQDAELMNTAERQLRQGFVRKVLGIVSLQLLLTLLVGAWIVSSEHLQRQLSSTPALVCIYASPFIVLLVLACSTSARHAYPLNLLLLGAFTVAESFAVGLASSQYDTAIVLGAIGITAVLTLCLTTYALLTKADLTILGTGLFAVLTAIVVGSLVNIFLHVELLNVIISGVAAVLFSLYIVYDVQLLAGGTHSSAISPDEYILGALNIYLDIINLFLQILRLLQYLSDH